MKKVMMVVVAAVTGIVMAALGARNCLRAGSGRVAGNTITRDARPYRRTLRNAGAEETADAGAGCVRPG